MEARRRRSLAAGHKVFVRGCCQCVAAQPLKRGPVPSVRSALRNDVRYRSAAPPILCAVGILQYRDFANRFEVRWLIGLAIDRIVVVILSVYEEVIGARSRSVH